MRDGEDVGELDRRVRVEIEEEVVGQVDARLHRECSGWNSMQPRFDDVEQRGDVVDHQEVDLAALALAARHGASGHPVRCVRRRVLLVELVAGDAVRHPLHRERPVGEVGEDQVGDVVVVREEVALRVALVRPEDLVEVRQPDAAVAVLEPPVLTLFA